MNRRFIPPAVDAFFDETRADMAREMARGREGGLAEGIMIGRDEGYAAGLRAGQERADEAHRAELAKLRAAFAKQHSIETVLAALQQLLEAREETRRSLEDATRAVIASALRTVVPVLLSRTVGEEIAALIAAAVSERGIDRLTLRCHPKTLALVQAQGLQESETLIILPDDGMAPGTAVATWSGGGLSFDPAALLEQVVGILGPDLPHEEAITE